MQPRQVLIVEDNYLLLDMLTSLCERRGLRVVPASSGEAAVAAIRSAGSTPRGADLSLLIADINLPGLIDGWTVAHAFRALHADRPVVYTSTDSSGGRGVPGSLFLRKPFQVEAVNRLVRMMGDGLSDAPLCAAG